MAAPTEAQFARASLSGTVVDAGGLPLPGVTVTVRNEATGITRSVSTATTRVVEDVVWLKALLEEGPSWRGPAMLAADHDVV